MGKRSFEARDQRSDKAVAETVVVVVGGVASERAKSSRYMQVLSLLAGYLYGRFRKRLLD